VSVGAGAPAELLGKKVCALVTGGGYAEYCTAHAAHCLHVPEAMSLAEAAALPETLFTVWHNVFERGWAKEGETLLVHGGTSGIGTMAIMLGKAFDMNVITTCGSDAKCAAARKIGADPCDNRSAWRCESRYQHGQGHDAPRGDDRVYIARAQR
jgi:NADPH:quinone reductase-like Zn-dependent oxidoreductase